MENAPVRTATARPAPWRRALLAGSVVLSLVVLFSPGALVPPSPHDSDKAVHGLLFTLLAVAALLAGRRVLGTAAALVAYAVVSEVLQAVLPIHRDGDWRDALTDVLGVALGLVLAPPAERLLRRRPAGAPSGAPGTAGPRHP